jgi:hypothetical protein
MAALPLTFIPPEEPGISQLHIYESPTGADGTFTEIDTISAGSYPIYIDHYTTQNAISIDDWFAIAWSTVDGVVSPLSEPIKGGTTTLIGDIVQRVILRSPDLDENVVLQEAEATVCYLYRVDDPYSVDETTVTPLWKNSLAELTEIATLWATTVNRGATAQDYSAGLISERNTIDTRTALDNLTRWEKRIMRRLGIGGSLIASIQDSQYILNLTGVKSTFDSSRILSTRATLTDQIVVRDLSTGDLISPNVD